MVSLEILKFPDSRLKKVSLPVETITGDTSRLIQEMVETMYSAPGIGLAAPQVGVFQRIIILDIDHTNPGKNLIKLINPEIKRSDNPCDLAFALSSRPTHMSITPCKML